MITYKLIYSFHYVHFTNELNEAIKQGWTKNEPMNMAATPGSIVFSQLLFKQEEPQK